MKVKSLIGLAALVFGCEQMPINRPYHMGEDYVCSKYKFSNTGWVDAVFKDGNLLAWTNPEREEYDVTLSDHTGVAMTYKSDSSVNYFPNPRFRDPKWFKDEVSNTDLSRTDRLFKLLKECEERMKKGSGF